MTAFSIFFEQPFMLEEAYLLYTADLYGLGKLFKHM